jgi:uncharacterized protein (TIGR02598 family)
MKCQSDETSAFSLVEVTLAIGVAAFCLIAVMGLLPVATQTSRKASQQTTANAILSAVIADLRTVPKGAGNSSKQFKTNFPNNANSPNYLYFSNDGSTASKPDHPASDTVFYVTSSYINAPAGSGSRTATLLNVKVSWPYNGNTSSTPDGFVETVISLDRN